MHKLEKMEGKEGVTHAGAEAGEVVLLLAVLGVFALTFVPPFGARLAVLDCELTLP